MNEQVASGMTRIKHKFLKHEINPKTETLIIGTFNPCALKNKAEFFYSTGRNDLWTLLPQAFDEPSLKGKDCAAKINFLHTKRIDFIDLISEVEVEAGRAGSRDDSYIDNKVTEWRDVIQEMDKLLSLKRACFTRRTFVGIPKMQKQVKRIDEYCQNRGICFKLIVTPSKQFRGENKQPEWTKFFNPMQ